MSTVRLLSLSKTGINEEVPLTQWILKKVPLEPKNFKDSFANKLLSRLWQFLFLHPSTSARFREHYFTVQNGPEVLQILVAATFSDDRHEVDASRPPLSPTKRIKVKNSQREAKLAKRVSRHRETMDDTPFISLGYKPPDTRAAADDICSELLGRLGSVLKASHTRPYA